jgi:hypothetical protein
MILHFLSLSGKWPLGGDKDNYSMPNAYKLYYSLRPKMIVLDQMVIDFVDVEIVWYFFCINKINKSLIFWGHKTP